jgi:seryl-tRNA synthetase
MGQEAGRSDAGTIPMRPTVAGPVLASVMPARTVAAIIETYQLPDGSLLIPEALQPYLHTERVSV